MQFCNNKTLITELNIPMMMNKTKLMTINNWATVHWATKSKVKNQYKQLLKDWFLDKDVRFPEDIHFVWQPIYKDARRRDAINIAPSVKIAEDSMVEEGILTDDNQTSHTILSSIIDKTIANHKFNIKIYGNTEPER